MTSVQSLKIGFVLDGGLEKPDGVQQYILALGDYFKASGHSVRHLVAGPIGVGINDAVSLSRSLHVKSNGNHLSIPLPASRSKLKKYMKDEQFDVLHVQTPYSPLMGGQLISLAGPRTAVIGTFHVLPSAWRYDFGNRLLGLWCHHTLKRFDQMLSVSQPAQVFCKRTFGLNSMVLPNVIDFQLYHSAKARAEYSDNKLNILFFGRLVHRKGCQVLLRAVDQLVKQRQSLPEFRLIICGSGPLEPKLKDYVLRHGLDKLVTFNGYIKEADKPSYYACADLAVFPSLGGESFGIVLIEAMAAGRAAVLAGNNPGYSSVLTQPQLLFDPRDVKALASKLYIFLTDHKERQRLAEWCAESAKQYDVSVVGDKLLSIYLDQLHKRGSQ